MKKEPQTDRPDAVVQDQEQEQDSGSLLDEIVSSQPRDSAAEQAAPRSFVGECVNERHPTIEGRALVRWAADDQQHEKWLACLQSVVVREADRVVLMSPDNWVEPVIMGVLGGLSERPRPEQVGATVALRPDESVCVTTGNGDKILQIHQEESGPVVRLLSDDVDIELPGKLRIQADAIEMKARRGPVDIEASDDVRVKGERVKMN